MERYAVALCYLPSDTYWIEFYWADDSDHAWEQAENANPEANILCVAKDYEV